VPCIRTGHTWSILPHVRWRLHHNHKSASVELNNPVASCQQAVDNLPTSSANTFCWQVVGTTSNKSVELNKPLPTCQQGWNKQWAHILFTSCWNSMHCYKSAAGLLQLVASRERKISFWEIKISVWSERHIFHFNFQIIFNQNVSTTVMMIFSVWSRQILFSGGWGLQLPNHF
jgi:hypothetical protein